MVHAFSFDLIYFLLVSESLNLKCHSWSGAITKGNLYHLFVLTWGPALDSLARAYRSQDLFGRRLLMHHWLMWCELNSSQSFFTKPTPARLPNSLFEHWIITLQDYSFRDGKLYRKSQNDEHCSFLNKLFLHVFAAFVGSLLFMLQFFHVPTHCQGMMGCPSHQTQTVELIPSSIIMLIGFYGESLAGVRPTIPWNCQFPSSAQAKEVPYLERTDFFNNVKKSIAEKSTETWLDLQISFVFFICYFLQFRWYRGFCLLWAHRIQVLMWSELNYKADWHRIAARMAKRGHPHPAKQCFVRYLHKLHPQLKKGKFTKQEEGKRWDKGGHRFISCSFLWQGFPNSDRWSKNKNQQH